MRATPENYPQWLLFFINRSSCKFHDFLKQNATHRFSRYTSSVILVPLFVTIPFMYNKTVDYLFSDREL